MPRSHIGPSRGVDAVSVLTAYVVLLMAVPAPMVVGPLGSAGSPANLLAIAAFFWWLWYHIQRDEPLQQGFQPIRVGMLVWLLVMLVVYVHAMAGPIAGDEISPADSGMLRLVGWAGVLLVANDGIPSLERNRVLVRRLVVCVGLVAVLGVVQLVTGQLWVDRIDIPGLSPASAGEVARRSGLIRPSGTATHPLEFGMVLTMMLPLAVVYALRAAKRRWLFMTFLLAIGFTIFLSISRSAMICALVAVVVLISSWRPAAQLKAVAFMLAMFVLVYLSVPGLLGTISRLFTGVSDDPSVASRTGSYDIASDFISRSPILGRGFGTFLPKYWILDNGYLGLLIEGGVIGLTALLALVVIGIAVARKARTYATDPFDREIAQALFASLAAGASGLAFFDTFGFPQSAGCFFLVLGLAGSTWRLTRADAKEREERAVGTR